MESYFTVRTQKYYLRHFHDKTLQHSIPTVPYSLHALCLAGLDYDHVRKGVLFGLSFYSQCLAKKGIQDKSVA